MSLEKSDELKELISAARGEEKADLVLKNAKVLNVFTGELEECDVAIRNGYIAGLGSYEGYAEIGLTGKIICPGLIDGHIHIESSMLAPSEFAKAVLPHGTTAVICDPHEIANVAGAEGLSFMLESSKDLPFEVKLANLLRYERGREDRSYNGDAGHKRQRDAVGDHHHKRSDDRKDAGKQ